MTAVDRDDMIVISMGIDGLLESVRRTEDWWRVHDDRAMLRRTQLFRRVILTTREKFFPGADASEIASALVTADGLRDAARQCSSQQMALQARLVAAAEAIERLCCLPREDASAGFR